MYYLVNSKLISKKDIYLFRLKNYVINFDNLPDLVIFIQK